MADSMTNPTAAAPADVKPADLSAHTARLQAAFAQALTEDDIRAIARKLVDQAREGDRTSARLVLKYGLATAVPAAPKRNIAAKPDYSSVSFVADTAKVLRELDALEAQARRQGGPPPTARR